MPADPNENPFAFFQKSLEELKKQLHQANGGIKAPGEDGWWNYIDAEHISLWEVEQYHSVFSGLFYKAARNKRTLYNLSFRDYTFKLPENCDDPAKAYEELAKSFNEEIKNMGLQLLDVEKSIKRHDDGPVQKLLYHTADSVLMSHITNAKSEKRIMLYAASLSESVVDMARDIAKKYLDLASTDHDLYILTETEDGLTLQSIGKPGEPIERGNYNDDVLAGFDYIKDQFCKSDPFGRLVIIHGLPGGGKSRLLKNFIHELNMGECKFICLQPEFLSKYNIAVLTKVFLDASFDGDKLILLIEDADECLVPRQSDNMTAISTLLNFADGFIGNMLDIRIITTTNAKSPSIDAALKRPGRLCKVMEVGKLNAQKSNEAYKRISGKEEEPFDKPTVLAEVYEKAYRDMGIIPPEIDNLSTKESVGFR